MARSYWLWCKTLGAFNSKKIFGNSTCPRERYIPVTQTRPKPQRVWLLLYKRAVFCPMERDHLQKWSQIFQIFQTEPKCSVPFDFWPKFREFWAEWKAPFVSVQMIASSDGDVKPLVLSPSDPSFISQIEGDLNDQHYCSKEESRGRSR